MPLWPFPGSRQKILSVPQKAPSLTFPTQYPIILWKVTIILTFVTTIHFTLSWTSQKWNQIMCICLRQALFFSIESMTFIHVGDVGTVHSLLLPCSSPPYERHSVCIHHSVGGHTDCFQFGVIKNKVTSTFLCLSFAGHKRSLLLGIHPGIRGDKCSVLVDVAKLPKGMCQFTLLVRWGEF